MNDNNTNNKICNNAYCNDGDIIYEKNFENMCPGFDIYPTIISHKERVIAIGDIHGDMNLAVNFLKAAKLIEEVVNPLIAINHSYKEYIHKLVITSDTSRHELQFSKNNDPNNDPNLKNQFDVVYRYYKINGIYYVKIIQTENNKNLETGDDPTRWFKWIGSNTYVVQVGDQIDRCRPMDKQCIDLKATVKDEDSDIEIMLFYDSLDKIAKKEGGRVFSLLGNHEIMNVLGDMRYVSHKGIKEYSPLADLNEALIDGYKKRKTAFENIMAKKMACTRSTVLVIGDYLFVHGGVAHKLANTYNLIDINAIIRQFLFGAPNITTPTTTNTTTNRTTTNATNKTNKTTNNALHDLLNSTKFSPLWYRKLAYIPPENFPHIIPNTNQSTNQSTTQTQNQHPQCQQLLDPIFEKINNKNQYRFEIARANDPTIQIKGMVIGHTPQFSLFNQGITTACNSRIIRTDIGASSAFDVFVQGNMTPQLEHARHPQVVEIKTNLYTKETSVKILYL